MFKFFSHQCGIGHIFGLRCIRVYSQKMLYNSVNSKLQQNRRARGSFRHIVLKII